MSEAQRRKERIWLEQDGSIANPHGFQFDRDHAYRITIVGRRAADMQRRGFSGYGHLGASSGLIIVDEYVWRKGVGTVSR